MKYRVALFALVGVVLCSAAGAALTFSTGGASVLAHCKQPSHVEVVLTDTARPVVSVTATYLARMDCHNDPTYTGWGVVISVRRQPLEGLHLYPQTAAWLVGALRGQAGAATAGQSVTVLHTVSRDFTEFVTLTPAAALGLADAVESAMGGH